MSPAGAQAVRRRPRSFPIDILAVSDALNLDDMRIAEHFINDAIIPGADSISARGTGELLGAVGQRVIGELSDGGYNASHFLTRQTANVFPGRVAPLNC